MAGFIHYTPNPYTKSFSVFKYNSSAKLLPNKRSGFFYGHMQNMRKFLMKTSLRFSKYIFIRHTLFLSFLLTQNTLFMKFLYQFDHLDVISLT